MDQANRIVNDQFTVVKELPEMGSILCKNCGEIIGTLPTNGVKKLYGLCVDPCTHQEIEL